MKIATGKLPELETINLVSERDRVRMAQLSNQAGVQGMHSNGSQG